MCIIDLHNDNEPTTANAVCGAAEVLSSVWTTYLDNPISHIKQRKKVLPPNFYLHIEDATFLTPDNINEIISLKPFSVGLTWNFDNSLAGGAKGSGGFTKWGYEAVRRFESAGIQIDTAHLNRKSFYQFAKVTTRPLLCTHTAFDALHRHKRNLTDKQIQTIIKSNGLIGFAFVREFLGKHSAADHISYFINKFGAKHLAIGADFYPETEPPKDVTCYADIAKLKIKHKKEILHTNAYEFLHRNR